MRLRTSTRRLRRTHTRRPAPPPVIDGATAVVDLLRADLDRMLDEIAHAGPGGHHALVLQFERTWAQFKDAVRRRG